MAKSEQVYLPPERGCKFTLTRIKAQALLKHLKDDKVAEDIYNHIVERLKTGKGKTTVSFYIAEEDLDSFVCIQYACMEAYFDSMTSYDSLDSIHEEGKELVDSYIEERELRQLKKKKASKGGWDYD